MVRGVKSRPVTPVAEEGTLDVSTAALLTRSIGVGELTAVDVMTDRGRLHTLDAEDTADAVVDLARTTGHSRFPVIGSDVDDGPSGKRASLANFF